MRLLDIALLVSAGFAGGTVNAIAGGATFFTFPAMLAAGVPPVAANASNTVALFPASLAASVALRRELATVRPHLPRLLTVGLAGGIAGAVLLLATSDRAFMALVPWLLLLATLIFAFSPQLLAWVRAHRGADTIIFRPSAGTLVLIAVCAVYGGYFGAGVGIMMMAGLALAGLEDLQVANALKNLLAGAINGIAVVVFVASGVVVWPAALVMLAGAVLGGVFGARIARRIPKLVFRWLVIAIGSLLTVWYFLRP
jgi:uncharacterized membrane protein YfcA